MAAQLVRAVNALRPATPVSVAGVSMGGAVALEVARIRPDWLRSFAMFNSAPRFGDPAGWTDLTTRVRHGGTTVLRDESLRGWFTPGFRLRYPDVVDAHLKDLESVDDLSYVWCCNALARYDATDRLRTVDVPALVVAGQRDRATNPEISRFTADALPEARLVEIPDAAHLAVVEHPSRAARLLVELMT